jgi:hypothetical protein
MHAVLLVAVLLGVAAGTSDVQVYSRCLIRAVIRSHIKLYPVANPCDTRYTVRVVML